MAITEEELIKQGFKKYNTSEYSNDAKKYLFQKRYTNDYGDILYYLDIYKWDWSIFPVERIPESYSYEITTQLYKRGNHDAINIQFGNQSTIEDAEKFINSLFKYGLVEPYEKTTKMKDCCAYDEIECEKYDCYECPFYIDT